MSEDTPRYEVNESSALIQTAETVARLGNRSVVLDLRRSFLAAIETLERVAGISPTTQEVREFWCQAHRSNNGYHKQ